MILANFQHVELPPVTQYVYTHTHTHSHTHTHTHTHTGVITRSARPIEDRALNKELNQPCSTRRKLFQLCMCTQKQFGAFALHPSKSVRHCV